KERVQDMRKSETSIHRKGLLLLSIGLATSIAQAQESGTGNSSAATQNLEVQEIVVKGQALRAGGSAFSNTGFTAESIRDKRLADTQELLRDVQGVDIRNLG